MLTHLTLPWSMVPHPSSAVQIGTFIRRGRHLTGSPIKKISVKNNNAQCTLGRACGGRRDIKGGGYVAKDPSNQGMMVGWADWEMHLVG